MGPVYFFAGVDGLCHVTKRKSGGAQGGVQQVWKTPLGTGAGLECTRRKGATGCRAKGG